MANKNVTLDAKIHNRFDIEVVDAETGEVKQRAQAYNVICNQLWGYLLRDSYNKYFNAIHYGTGTGTPSASDTQLFTFLGSKNTTFEAEGVDHENGYYYMRKSIQIEPETAVGATLTEVGIAYDSQSNSLCTHAVLRDMNGNPISIQKTATDVVNVYATVYVHFNPQGYGGIYISDGASLTTSLFNHLAGSSSTYNYYYSSPYRYGLRSDFNASPNSMYNSNVANTEYNVQSKRMVITFTRVGAPNANFGGARCATVDFRIALTASSNIEWGMLLLMPGSSWYPYSTITNEAVGTGDGSTKDFALDFPFVRNATVYVNGVAQNGVTVDYAPSASNFQSAIIPCHNISKFYPYYPGTSPYNSDTKAVLYNQAYSVGLGSINIRAGDVEASNDLSHWTTIGSSASDGTFTIPAAYQHYKYYRCKLRGDAINSFTVTAPASFTGNVVHFSTPPADGAVITADYQCDCIAKDADHVFDLTITLQLGEYTE